MLKTTLNVIETGEQSVFRVTPPVRRVVIFPPARRHCRAAYRARALRGHARAVLSPPEQHRYAPDGACLGFADLISTQLASFELERQDELTARVELRALQSQVDLHFLFNTIAHRVARRTEPTRRDRC
ncbi:MAG: hypothetical protein ACLTYW_10945 [Collinsella sp.]